MKDNNASNSRLMGCVAHTSDGPAQSPNELDPDTLSYFFVHKSIHAEDRRSASDPPSDSYSRDRSFDKSPKAPNSQTSRNSRGTKCRGRKRNSIGSSRSASSRYRSIKDWSAGVDSTSPSSFAPNGPPVRHGLDPPRPPKSGSEWVWFPEGYWAEREIRGFMPPRAAAMKQKWWNRSLDQKIKSPKTASGDKTTCSDKTPPPFIIPRIQIGSASSRSTNSTKSISKTSRRTSENETQKNNNLWGFNFIKSVQQGDSNTTGQFEVLYCKAKRKIETRLRKISADKLSVNSLETPSSRASRTTILLQGTSSYFDRMHRRGRRQNLAAGMSPSSSSPDSKSRPQFGLAPWHRRHSHDSVLTVSSSVHKLLMGKTPIATPIPEKHYAGPGGKEYPTVQIASPDPHEPNFLPSEARRINTPPLCPGTPTIQPRGFFFDLNAPDDTGSQGYSPHFSPEASDTPKSRPGDGSPPPWREWWEADTKPPNRRNKSPHTTKSPPLALMSPTAFELNLPEHLLNSPLCPKSLKHQSGGTSICAYHGRKRSIGLRHLERISTEEGGVPSTES